MPLPKRYDPQEQELAWQQQWPTQGTYHFDAAATPDTPFYTIDTPPPTVSGQLHLGHVYSYSHTDFMARFHRMNGYNVFYPMGFDDNGLPTERLVEKGAGVKVAEVGREVFIQHCLDAADCDVFFTAGTSSVVYPAAGLLDVARRHGALTVEINPDDTPSSAGIDVRLATGAEIAFVEIERAIAQR